MPRDVAAASWFSQRPGAHNARPDLTRERAGYVLESFSSTGEGADRRLTVVIVRRPDPGDEELPEVRVVHSASGLTSGAFPQRVDETAGGVRYTFMVRPPQAGFRGSERPGAERYGVHFNPARHVELPPPIALAPTFGQAPLEVRRNQGPPRLPRAERVAGKRIERRSPSDPGRVVDRPQVAGSRQDRR
jgi:hypothetical protein